MVEALIAHRDRCKQLGLKCSLDVDGYCDFIFYNSNGRPWNVSMVDDLLNRIVAQYNKTKKPDEQELPHISCHILRHTYANFLDEIDMKMTTRKSIVGHSDIKTTINIYTNSDAEKLSNEVIRTDLSQQFSAIYAPSI